MTPRFRSGHHRLARLHDQAVSLGHATDRRVAVQAVDVFGHTFILQAYHRLEMISVSAVAQLTPAVCAAASEFRMKLDALFLGQLMPRIPMGIFESRTGQFL